MCEEIRSHKTVNIMSVFCPKSAQIIHSDLQMSFLFVPHSQRRQVHHGLKLCARGRMGTRFCVSQKPDLLCGRDVDGRSIQSRVDDKVCVDSCTSWSG